MKTATATAPGKIILFGEHAVVYGRPALAVPLHDVCAKATVSEKMPGSGLIIDAPDIGVRLSAETAPTHPLAVTARLVLEHNSCQPPDALIRIESTIPIAAGLGSGAAVTAAVAGALSKYLGNALDSATLSDIVFEVEKLHHGTPSGIDNTVICFARPVYFVKSMPPETFKAAMPFHLIVGDTGVASPTKLAVASVREGWERDRLTYERLFSAIGEIAASARQAITSGDIDRLGEMMTANQALLRQLDVSSPELERLIEAARTAGAVGAKLSGGGRGGNMIALVHHEDTDHVETALKQAGAVRVFHSTIQ